MKKVVLFLVLIVLTIIATPKLIHISQRQEVNSFLGSIEREIKNEELLIKQGDFYSVGMTHVKIQDIIGRTRDDLIYAGIWTEDDEKKLQELFLKSIELTNYADKQCNALN